jgi:hypothetical protein
MILPTYLFLLLAVVAAADWTTQVYDAIIVGAGPAGIIGMCLLFLPELCIVALLALPSLSPAFFHAFTVRASSQQVLRAAIIWELLLHWQQQPAISLV